MRGTLGNRLGRRQRHTAARVGVPQEGGLPAQTIRELRRHAIDARAYLGPCAKIDRADATPHRDYQGTTQL